ncbi:MAG TPA: hypothetical protein VHD15_12750 [Hyphomicrobiales bacterium]|nr:hypothetical protein [Hyphomicrobiales bacterium]
MAQDKDIHGEGNYTASKKFDDAEHAFVERNKDKIADMGKDAEKALEGREGADLRKAEEEAKSHSHARGK